MTRPLGDRHLAPDGGPVRLRHRDCGALVHVGCNAGHAVEADDVDVAPGPALEDTEGSRQPAPRATSDR